MKRLLIMLALCLTYATSFGAASETALTLRQVKDLSTFDEEPGNELKKNRTFLTHLPVKALEPFSTLNTIPGGHKKVAIITLRNELDPSDSEMVLPLSVSKSDPSLFHLPGHSVSFRRDPSTAKFYAFMHNQNNNTNHALVEIKEGGEWLVLSHEEKAACAHHTPPCDDCIVFDMTVGILVETTDE